MEQSSVVLKSKTMVFSDTKEQSIECEMLLPDYYPEVEKVLQCSMELSEESVSLHADKISVAGKAGFTILFLSAEKQLYSFSTTEKYTKMIPCGETQSGDFCTVRQTKTQLSFRASAPRKIELRAVAAVHAELYRFTSAEALSGLDGPSVESLPKETACFVTHALQAVSLDLMKSVKLPVARDKVTAVVRKSARLRFTEIKTIANKVMLNGDLDAALTLATNDGAVYSDLQFRLPVTEVKEVFGVEENDACYISAGRCAVDVNLKASQGESDLCELQIRSSCVLLAGRQEKTSFLTDAYCTDAALHVTAAPVQLDSAVSSVQTTFPFSAQAEYYDDSVTEVCAAFVSDIRFFCAAEKEKTKISGSATVNALLKNKADAFSFVSRSATFTFEKPEAAGQRQRFYEVDCQSVSASLASSGLLQFTGEFCLHGFETEQKVEEMLTAAALPENESTRGIHEKIVVYYASKGETLWNIAKENKSTVKQITAHNQLKDSALQENTVLVFPAY